LIRSGAISEKVAGEKNGFFTKPCTASKKNLSKYRRHLCQYYYLGIGADHLQQQLQQILMQLQQEKQQP
jgi:hypothetical protein